MKALKLSVILMGVLIVVGLAVVVITVTRRANHPGATAGAPQAASGVSPPIAGAPAGALPSFGPVTLKYPPGFEPVETIANGDRLVVRFQSQTGAGRVVVLDLRTGRVLGTVTLAPEAQ